MNFESLLKFGVDQGATAVHLQAGSSPQLRIGGLIRNVEGAPLEADELGVFIKTLAPKVFAPDLGEATTPDRSFSALVPPAGRFRCTIYNHVGGPGLVLGVIPPAVRSIEELHLPPAVRQVALAPRGLVLVVGPASSGKTTTLAAMVDAINAALYQKIVTVEAPVEYLHTNKKALITQMEVGLHVSSFEHGLALAQLQDADVLAVADLRDGAVVRTVLNAVESGRKVLASMTGLYTAQALGRLLALLAPEDRETGVAQLAASLEGVIAQRLARTRDGKLRPAVELLRGGMNTSKSIRENRLQDLGFIIDGRQGGMQSLDQHLIELHQSGAISGTEALRLASNPEAVAVVLRTPPDPAPTDTAAEPELLP
jgi:twitching motility protein PilT